MKKVNRYEPIFVAFYLSILLLFGCSAAKLPVDAVIDEIRSCRKIVKKHEAITAGDTAGDVKKYLQLHLTISAKRKIQTNKVWLKKILDQGRVEDFKKLDAKLNKI